MADTITEFINVANKGFSDLVAGIPVVTNSATETAVIKDVYISTSRSRNISLSVGGTEIASTSTTGRLTGTELVGAGTTVMASNGSKALVNRFTTISYSATAISSYVANIDTIFSDENFASAQRSRSKLSNTVNGPAPTVTPHFSCFDQSGNFYYAAIGGESGVGTVGVGKNRIYKRDGGVNGLESALPMAYPMNTNGATGNSQFFTWDGVKNIFAVYWDVNSIAYIYKYDTSTGNTINFAAPAIGQGSIGTVGAASAVGDYLFINSITYIYVYNHVTSAFIGQFFTGQSPKSSNRRASLLAARDTSGNYFVLWNDDGSTISKVYNFGRDFTSGMPTPTTTALSAPTGYVFGSNLGSSYVSGTDPSFSGRFVKLPGNTAKAFLISQQIILMIDFDTLTCYVYTPRTVSISVANNATITSIDLTNADIDFGVVGIRATGIKTTA